jgi:hypothetical protein
MASEIARGSLVRLRSTGEMGVVVASWFDDDLDDVDCSVAFFGDALPVPGPRPPTTPYILRYLAFSLELVDASGEAPLPGDEG